MASAFDTAFAAAGLPGLMDQFGETVSYVAGSSSAVNITAIVDRDLFGSPRDSAMARLLDQDGGMRTYTEAHAIATIYTDATNGITAPALGDQVTFDSLEYRVVGVGLDSGKGVAVLLLRRKVHIRQGNRSL